MFKKILYCLKEPLLRLLRRDLPVIWMYFFCSISAISQNITRVEYFIDTDPGYGMATNSPITPGANLSNLVLPINVATTGPGFHNLYIRAKDVNQKWGLTAVRTFYKEASNIALANVTKLEYFIDTDPGNGLATNVPITPGNNLSNLIFPIDVSATTPGFHNLFIRAKDTYQKWGLTAVRTFYKEASNIELSNVIKVEYFIDTDPGIGLATNLPMAPGTNLSNLVFPLDMAQISNGFHNLYIRAKDANQKWSLTAVRNFYNETVNLSLPSVSKVEYFIDIDPGIGLATNVPITPGINLANLNFLVDSTTLSYGQHAVYVRARDYNGKWSLTNMDTITYYARPTIIALGSTNVCPGETIELQTLFGPGYLYQWYKDNTPIPGATSSIYVASESGNYYVQVNFNGRFIDTSDILEVTYKPNTPVPIIIGPSAICVLTSGNTYATESGMSEYVWTISAGGVVTSGGTSSSSTITVNWQGEGAQTVSVNYTGENGCHAITPTVYNISVNPLPVPALNGQNPVCKGVSFQYLTDAGMTEYTWTVSSGGSIMGSSTGPSVTIKWNFTGAQWVKVNYTNANGCRATNPTQYDIAVNPLPAAAQAISGLTTIYQGQSNMVYSVPAIPNATSYIWVLPAGVIGTSTSNEISLSFPGASQSGNISVRGQNLCGDNGVPSFLFVNVYKQFNLNLFLEGLYAGNQMMNMAQDENGNHFGTGISDKIDVELHNSSPPYAIKYAVYDLDLNIDGTCDIDLPSQFMNSYYIAIKHRNHIETWSAAPVSFAGTNVMYNFDNPSKAFGGNLLLMAGGGYAIYGGDVNQDSAIDTADLTPIDNDSGNYASGYLNTDVNGDGITDTADLTIADNNAAAYVGAATPP